MAGGSCSTFTRRTMQATMQVHRVFQHASMRSNMILTCQIFLLDRVLWTYRFRRLKWKILHMIHGSLLERALQSVERNHFGQLIALAWQPGHRIARRFDFMSHPNPKASLHLPIQQPQSLRPSISSVQTGLVDHSYPKLALLLGPRSLARDLSVLPMLHIQESQTGRLHCLYQSERKIDCVHLEGHAVELCFDKQ